MNEIMKMETIVFLSILVFILLVLTYAALEIKREKSHYLTNRKKFQFASFMFFYPPWWMIEDNDQKNSVSIKSKNWTATIELKEVKNIKKRLEEMDIVFDQEYSEAIPAILISKDRKIVRIEGLATIQEEYRAYVDIWQIDLNSNQQIVCISRCGPLEGAIENVYFEEMFRSAYPLLGEKSLILPMR